MPYFIGSIAIAAIIDAKLDPQFFSRKFKRGWRAIVNATLLGAIIPACSCTSMPIAENLKTKSNHLGAVMAFIIISPALGPHSIILTFFILGPKFGFFRIVSAMLLAFIAGLIFEYLQRNGFTGFNSMQTEIKSSCCMKSKTIVKSFTSIIKKLIPYFLVGLLIASILMVIVPPQFILHYINDTGPLKYFIAAVLGIPVYVCAGEEIPITHSFLSLGLAPGAAFTLMMASVGTCIPTMLMAQKMVGKRATVLYVITWFIYAIFSGWLFSKI